MVDIDSKGKGSIEESTLGDRDSLPDIAIAGARDGRSVIAGEDCCRYRCDGCKCHFLATAEFPLPEIFIPSRMGYPILWDSPQGGPMNTSQMVDHADRCDGVIRRELL